MNNDLISRSEAIDVIRSMTISLGGVEIFNPEVKKSVLGALDDIPTIDAELVRRGRWEHGMQCQYCGQVDLAKPNYCCNCGAKMDAEVEG